MNKRRRGLPSRCARCLYVTDSVGEEKPEYLEFTCLHCGGLKKRITYEVINARLEAALLNMDNDMDEPQ